MRSKTDSCVSKIIEWGDRIIAKNTKEEPFRYALLDERNMLADLIQTLKFRIQDIDEMLERGDEDGV